MVLALFPTSTRIETGRERAWSRAGHPRTAHPLSDATHPGPIMPPHPRILYRDAAPADGTTQAARRGVSVLVDRNRVVWIRPTSDEGDLPEEARVIDAGGSTITDRKSTRLNSSHGSISYAVFCLKK